MNFRSLLVLLIVMCAQVAVGQQADRVQRGQRGYTPPPLPREQGAISVENTLELLDEKMKIYEAEFSLDSFEKEVMKNMITDFENDKMSLLGNENLPYDQKLQGIEKAKDKLSKDLGVFLTSEETARFGELHFVRKKIEKEIKMKDKKKGKKKKKGKDKSESA